MIISLRRAAGVAAVSLLGLLPVASAMTGNAAGAIAPQHRQIAVTRLTSFKVVLTVTRGPTSGGAPMATVTAAGYRHTASGWKLIAVKRIGKANQWFWYSTDVCGLKTTQLKPEPSSAAPSDTIRVRLLITPALGCSVPYTKAWKP